MKQNIVVENIIQSFCLLLAIMGLTIVMNDLSETSPEPIKIGVIDSGIFSPHGLFKDRIVASVAIDHYKNLNQNDENGHGTHVAGIIVSKTYKNTEIYSFKNIFENNPSIVTGSTNNSLNKNETTKEDHFTDFENIIEESHKMGIKILNISEYITTNSVDYLTLVKVFKKAENYGIFVVVASGNDKIDLDQLTVDKNVYPCALKLSNMICVGNISDTLEVNSNFGRYYIDVWAKGNGVVSSYKDNTYVRMNGSSMAAPQISALAARLWANNPHLTTSELKKLLLSKLTFNLELAKVSTYGLFLK